MDVPVNRSRTFTNITHVTQHCGNRCTDPKNRFFGNFSCYSFLQLEDVKIQFQNFILIYKVGLWTFSWGVEVTYLGQNRVFNRIRYWLFRNYKTEGFAGFWLGLYHFKWWDRRGSGDWCVTFCYKEVLIAQNLICALAA